MLVVANCSSFGLGRRNRKKAGALGSVDASEPLGGLAAVLEAGLPFQLAYLTRVLKPPPSGAGKNSSRRPVTKTVRNEESAWARCGAARSTWMQPVYVAFVIDAYSFRVVSCRVSPGR